VFHISDDGKSWIDKGEIEQWTGGYIQMLEIFDGHSVVWTNTNIYYKNSSQLYMSESTIIDPDISEEITFQSFEPSVTAIDFPSSDVTTIEFSLNPNIDFSKDTDFQDHQDLSLEFIEKNE
jgi:hypothetical protein